MVHADGPQHPPIDGSHLFSMEDVVEDPKAGDLPQFASVN